MAGKKHGAGKKRGAQGKRGASKLSTLKKGGGLKEVGKNKLGIAPVHKLHQHDVLFGRGSYTNEHNKGTMWTKLVNEQKRLYHQKQDSAHKREVAMNIIMQLSQLEPPTRFLAQSESKGWYPVGESQALTKTMQKLRHDAVTIKSAVEEERFLSRLSCHGGGSAAVQPQLQTSYPTAAQTPSYPATTQTTPPFTAAAPYMPLHQHPGGLLSLHPNAAAHQVAMTLPCTNMAVNQASSSPFVPFGAHHAAMSSTMRMLPQQQSLGPGLQHHVHTMVYPPSYLGVGADIGMAVDHATPATAPTGVGPSGAVTNTFANGIMRHVEKHGDHLQKSNPPSTIVITAPTEHGKATQEQQRAVLTDQTKPKSNSRESRQPGNEERVHQEEAASQAVVITTLNRATSEFSLVVEAALCDTNMCYGGEEEDATYSALRSSVDMLQQAKQILQNQSASRQKLLDIQDQLKELKKSNTMLQQETVGLRQTCQRLTAQDSSLTERLERYQPYQQDWKRLTAQNHSLTEQNHTLTERLGRYKQDTTKPEED